MTQRIVLEVPDSMADAIESEFEERADRISGSLESSRWSRQSDMVEEAMSERVNGVADATMELLRMEVLD